MRCYHCHSTKTSKAGFTANGKQRRYCRSCRRFFRDNPAVKTLNKPTSAIISSVPAIPQDGILLESSLETQSLALEASFPNNERNHLILKLQAIAQDLGHTPTTEDIILLTKKKKSVPLDVYYRVFGSFLAALKAANLKPRYKQEFDRERLLTELSALRKRLKRRLIARDVAQARRKKKRISPPYHFQRAFGSVPEAIKAAEAGRKEYSRSELLAYLRELSEKLNRPPIGRDLKEHYRFGKTPSLKAVLKEFGSLTKARKTAGISYASGNSSSITNSVSLARTESRRGKIRDKWNGSKTSDVNKRRSVRGGNTGVNGNQQWRKYTPDELIQQLQDLAKQLGRKPTDRDINRASKEGLCASAVTFARYFGSLPAAYETAGFGKIRPQAYTREEIKAALRKLMKELDGRFPSFHELVAASKAGKCPSPNTIYRHLGTLEQVKASLFD